MRIGELADRAGVSAKTVRFYESIGLMEEPVRRANGYRQYDEAALERLRFIRDAQAAGLTLAEAREIVELKARGEATCHHTTAILERHLADVERQIASLQAAQAEMAGLLERAQSLDPAACTDGSACQVIRVGDGARLDLPVHSNV